MKGSAEKNCAGILDSHPKALGNVVDRGVLYTLRVLKKPNTKVPNMALAVLQFAKMTRAMAIHP